MAFVRNWVIFCVLVVVLGVGVSVAPHFLHAQTTDTTASSDVAARRAQLQSQLDQLNAQIATTQSTLNTLHGQHQSIQNDINILDANIKKSKLQIQATQLQLKALSENITLHNTAITVLAGKIDNEREALGDIIRQTDELENYSFVTLMLSSQNVSSFFGDLDSFMTLKGEIAASSAQLADTKSQKEVEKDELTDQAKQKQQLQALAIEQQQQVQSQEAEKQKLLSQTKSQEATYQSIYDTQQKTKSQIEAELFALAGGGGAIPLPTAIADAKIAGSATGVRPAFILAILSQESDLGKNIGQCYVTDLSTGDGKGKNTGTPFEGVMKAPRDTVPFKAIMDALSRDWSTTPVSCPQSGGYGGAMGPTQFIPSTWQLYAPRIEKALNVTQADPWNALHAIMATGIYMADLGASAQTDASEREAAGRYFAGGAWATSGQAYSDSVLQKAAQFQYDIQTLGS